MATIEQAWQQIDQHAERLNQQTLTNLFAQAEAKRFPHFSASFNDFLFDFSKEKIDQAALNALFDLARACRVEAMRDAMLQGKEINFTEHRAVLHPALRGGVDESLKLAGDEQTVTQQVVAEQKRFLQFAEEVRNGEYASCDAVPFTDVVNIGIGGSDLGPAMATQALSPWQGRVSIHFASNADGAHIADILKELNPRTTLVIIASKTFTTAETMLNFKTALQWLKNSLGEQASQHLAAVSTNLEATRSYGIDDSRVFGFWEWVGGRYSLWSAIGLPLAISIGADNFKCFLSGAQRMDEHFKTAPIEQNIPILYALIGIWRRNGLKHSNIALMPYDQRLARFPAYIQQLDMESNGKQTMRDGQPVVRKTGVHIWGEAGTNAQHSFFQLLHQGSEVIPVDFLLAAEATPSLALTTMEEHHQMLMANALAQSQALAFGRCEKEVRREMESQGYCQAKIDELAPHRSFSGDRPSSTILYRQLTPETLGSLIALFEHKVFVQGIIWNINSFDQWGVELGKKLAKEMQAALSQVSIPDNVDDSTQGLLEAIYRLRQEP